MKTLIELYDEEPLNNVLAAETFRPEKTVFLCPPEVSDRHRDALRAYFKSRGCPTRVSFVPVTLLDAERVAETLRQVVAREADCAIDIAGGTDAALFAAGEVCAALHVPTFTYSRRRNTFYEVHNAPFARGLVCDIRLKVEDCFRMAGGSALQGRGDAEALRSHDRQIIPFFETYMAARALWTGFITYIQRISQNAEGLEAEGPWVVKGERGTRASGDQALLHSLNRIGLIRDLKTTQEGVSFRFEDAWARFWLRDVGSVLEMYVWKACREAGVFDDVQLSAVVNWDGGDVSADSVMNEIDVAATRGVMPLFISCKTCPIKTEALNELDILRSRFGSPAARALIVTSASGGRTRAAMRRRAGALDIAVVEQNGLAMDDLIETLRMLSTMRDELHEDEA